MISPSIPAIHFFIKCSYVRGYGLSEIIKKVHRTFGDDEEVNKITYMYLALIHGAPYFEGE